MEKNIVLKIRDEVAFRESGDGAFFVISPLIDEIVTINDSHAVLWSLIDGKRDISEIIARFAAHFNAGSLDEITQMWSDMIEIIDKFLEKQLIEII